MLDLARGLSLNFSLDQTTLNDLMNMRDLELKRCCESESRGMEAYLAYIGEGMGKTLQEWESVVKKYQRKNGSLFNSPSTTSAAFIALGNTDCLKYLHSLVNTFGSAVPAVYPVDIYSQLCTVDNLERLGISRFFMKEIQRVLDQTYRCWVQGDEDIFMDASTCALAFRILRMNGYNVTSDPILHPSCVHGHMINVTTTLELYRASQLTLYPHETQLEEQKLRLRSKLEQELSSGSIQSPQLNAEVKQALDYPIYTIMDRMAKRKAIENYNIDNTRILKTSYSLANLGNKDFLHLSVEDYNQCQAIYREESREFDRWLVESRLNEVESARRRSASIAYCYSTAAAALFGPQVSDARMSWAKNSVLTTLLDDLFDVDGSVEDVRKLIHMVELWDVDVSTECCSHDVGILFSALKSTICEIADKGSKLQGRCIKSHIIAIWLDLLYASKQEVEWRENKSAPTLDEYMSTTFVSFALGPIVLPLLYLIGPKISQEMVNHSDYHNLFKLMSTIGRLFNDIRGYERECEEGKVCAVPLYIAENGGEMSAEAAISELESVIDSQTKELLRLVLEKKEKESSSALPRSCKELFWNMCSVLHLLYNKVDGFRSRDFLQVLDNVIHQPIVIEEL